MKKVIPNYPCAELEREYSRKVRGENGLYTQSVVRDTQFMKLFGGDLSHDVERVKQQRRKGAVLVALHNIPNEEQFKLVAEELSVDVQKPSKAEGAK